MLRATEKAITERLITSALNAGLLVGAYADDLADIEPTDNLKDILDSAFSYDCVDLILESPNGQMGFIALDYFNDGLEIITDYSTSLEKFVSKNNFKKIEIDL